jgi:hypothetical protein
LFFVWFGNQVVSLFGMQFDYSAFGSYSISGRRDKPEVLSLSGGRSSASTLLQLYNGGFGQNPEDITSFQNTGEEDETALQFLKDLQEYVPVPLIMLEFKLTEEFVSDILRSDFSYEAFYNNQYTSWFEIFNAKKLYNIKYRKSKHNEWYADNYQNSAAMFRQVSFETASRKAEPFISAFLYKFALRAAMRKQVLLPNAAQRWCTADMKIRVLERYLASIGVDRYVHYFGMRYDEPDRVDKIFRLNDTSDKVYHDCPLHWTKTTKSDVLRQWSNQPIDLGLSGHVNTFRDFMGNCGMCHLKARIKKLYLMQKGYNVSVYNQMERLVNNYNGFTQAFSNQHGTIQSLYEQAMNMPEISLEEVLSDEEKEIHCVTCGD